MRVNTLYIININPDDNEAIAGAAALFERNRQKNPSTRIVQVEVDAILMGLDDIKPKYIQGDATPPSDENVGAYIVGHGTSDGILGCDGERIGKILKLLGIPKLRKLCLLACAVAADRGQDGGAAAVQKRAIEEICEDLKGQGYTPMIAGWDDFVTVCAAGNESQFTKAELEQLKTGQSISPKSKPENFGKKVATKGKLLVQQKYRSHKFTCQWVHNSVKQIPLGPAVGGWSDKT